MHLVARPIHPIDSKSQGPYIYSDSPAPHTYLLRPPPEAGGVRLHRRVAQEVERRQQVLQRLIRLGLCVVDVLCRVV